jgi:two-component system, NtrC family, response regulator HydG
MSQKPKLSFGSSRVIRTVLDQCSHYARIVDPVLILGQPGTGKTVIARHIHELSGRPGPFISNSASNIPDHLEVSFFSGHVRGSFTGARDDQMGAIEAAHRGTFFLDELGDASPRVQQILRQFLENGVVRRMGEHRDRPVDVRFIAATNALLEDLVEAGSFRRDLLDRFGFFKIRMPQLADRRDEILVLVDFFLERAADRYGRPQRPVLTDEVRDCLRSAPWTGNVRELENLCKYIAVHMNPERRVEMADLPPDFVATLGDVMNQRHRRSSVERAREALERAGGNKTKAAELLGISRQHFYRMLGNDPDTRLPEP